MADLEVGRLLLISVILLLDKAPSPAHATSCFYYGFDCAIVATTISSSGRAKKTAHVLKCGENIKLFRDGGINCQITGSPQETRMTVSYSPKLHTRPVADLVDSDIGSVLAKFNIKFFHVNIYVRGYSHTWTKRFPPSISGLYVNIAVTECIDAYAFVWTSLSLSNRVVLLQSLTQNVKTKEWNYNLKYPVQCVTPDAESLKSSKLDLSSSCLWKSNYTFDGRSFAFYVRTASEFCEAFCPKKPEAQKLFLNRDASLDACHGFTGPPGPDSRAGMIVGVIFGILLLVALISVVLVYVICNRRVRRSMQNEFRVLWKSEGSDLDYCLDADTNRV